MLSKRKIFKIIIGGLSYILYLFLLKVICIVNMLYINYVVLN